MFCREVCVEEKEGGLKICIAENLGGCMEGRIYKCLVTSVRLQFVGAEKRPIPGVLSPARGISR